MGLATGLDNTLVENFFDGSGTNHAGSLELGILESGTEWSYSGYARQAVQRDTASSGQINVNNGTTSTDPINFPTVTGSAVTADTWALYDQSGNMVFSESAGGVAVNVGDYATIPAGSITLSVT